MKKFFNGFVKPIWKKSNEDLLFTHAASLTYYSFLYFIPILALFYFLFDYLDGFDQLSESIQSFVGTYLAPQFAETILSYVKIIQDEVSGATIGVFGVIGFFISSGLLLYQIEFSFNAMMGKHQPEHRIRRMLKYALLMITGPVFIGLSILAQRAAIKTVQGQLDVTIVAVLLALLPLLSTIFFLTFLYKWVSAVKLPWSVCIRAGIFSGVAIEVVKQLYAYYVIYALKNSAYGTMAVLPLFLVWINTIWTITLLGGQICCLLGTRDKVIPVDSDF